MSFRQAVWRRFGLVTGVCPVPLEIAGLGEDLGRVFLRIKQG